MGDLLGWDVIGWAIAFLVPLGVGVLSLSETRIAKACFALSALILGVKIIMWGAGTAQSFSTRALLVGGSMALLGILLVESYRWVDSKQIPTAPSPPSLPAVPDPTPAPPQKQSEEPHPKSQPKNQAPAHVKERPYLFRETISLLNDENVVQVVFSNASDYPAVEASTQIQWIMVDKAFDPTAFEPHLAPPGSTGNVPPHQRISVQAGTGKSDFPEQFSKVKTGELLAYVYGQATYNDLTGNSYQPRFCSLWLPVTNTFQECPKNIFVSKQRP